MLVEVSPQLALALNPLNTAARIEATSNLLSSNSETKSAEALVTRGLALDRADARFHSLAGIILEKNGDPEGARKSFESALLLQPVEIQALSRRFIAEISAQDFDAAAISAELIARRWAVHWPLVEPHVPAIIADPARLKKMADRFSAAPGLRSALITSLMKTPASLPLAFSVLQRWTVQPFDDTERYINGLTRAYLNSGNYPGAFLAFRLAISPDETVGYIYNGDFSKPPTGNAFDWNLKSPAGMSIRISQTPAKAKAELARSGFETSGNSLELRFLDAPVRFSGADTLLRLAPGGHELSLAYSTVNLRAPNPVRLAVSCFKTTNIISEIEFSPGDTDLKVEKTGFSIPSVGCPLQKISMYNQSFTESWKDRFSGSILVHDVRVTRAESRNPL